MPSPERMPGDEACVLGEYEALAHAVPGALDAIPGGVYLCDADGLLVRYNREASSMWGRRPRLGDPGERYCGAAALFLDDGRPLEREDTPMAHVLRTGESARNVQVVMQRPDGSRLVALVNVRALRGADGRIRGAINCFQDISAQKTLAEEAARRHRELEDFFDNGAIGLHIVDGRGVIVRANRAELEMLGYEEHEYVGRDVRELHVDAPVIDDILARLGRGERIERYPARLRARDGSLRHVLITSNARFEDGRLAGTRCFTMDVTAMHDALAARRESDERLAVTYENASVGLAETDEHGRFVRVNQALAGLSGYSREELLARRFVDITHPEDTEDEALYRRHVAGELDRYSVEKRYVRKDGEIIRVEVSASCVRDALGRFRYGVRVIRDVTERRRMQERLRDSERQVRELLDALPAAVYTTDTEGRITFYNQAAVELSGRVPRLGEDRWCVSHKLRGPDGQPMPLDQCPMAVALRTGQAIRGGEAVIERPDGIEVPFLAYPTPLLDDDGCMRGAVNMLVDISERKQAELRQRILIDELNHRVKNTLATVQALLWQTARHAGSLDDFVGTFKTRLMALARAHDLLTRRHWEGATLGDLLHDVLAPFAGGGTERLRLDGPEVTLTPRMAVDLAMAYNELATNAAKYGALSAPHGRLYVRWSLDADHGLALEWIEAQGPPVVPPTRRGFGTRMVEQCIRGELGGRVRMEFERDGFRCCVEVPLPAGEPRARERASDAVA